MTTELIDRLENKNMEIDENEKNATQEHGVICPKTACLLRALELKNPRIILPKSYWHWVECNRKDNNGIFTLCRPGSAPYPWSGVWVSAYTFTELWNALNMEICKDGNKYIKSVKGQYDYFECAYDSGLHEIFSSDVHENIQEAVAQTFMFVLKEKGELK